MVIVQSKFGPPQDPVLDSIRSLMSLIEVAAKENARMIIKKASRMLAKISKNL